MNKIGFVYIMTNKNKTTLYIGVTNNLCRRIYEHKNHLVKDSFTDKYNLGYCIYYEEFPYFDLAIKREKELKKWNRQKKEDLINKKNPEWKVMVTETGFVREKVLFSQQVSDLVNELQKEGVISSFALNDFSPEGDNEEIPPVGRNDDSPCVKKSEDSSLTLGMTSAPDCGMGVNAGGEAACIHSPFLPKTECHSEQSEETNIQKEQSEGIRETPPVGTNNSDAIGEEFPPAGRNDDSAIGDEIPPFGRNDRSEFPLVGRNDGSAIDNKIPPFSRNDSSTIGNEFPPAGRNDERL